MPTITSSLPSLSVISVNSHAHQTDNVNDGDSQMQSNPFDDGDDTELMFPSANDPPTPPRNSQPQTFQPTAELSPPASQDPREDLEMGESMDTRVNRMDGNGTLPSIFNPETDISSNNLSGGKARKSDEENQPGYAWMNKRAQEEWARALEHVVDKKWSMREFIKCRLLGHSSFVVLILAL